MTGLIWKDFLGLRKVLQSYLIILIIYVGLTVTGLWTASFTAGGLGVMAGMLPFTCFNMDYMAKWEPYGAALPVSRDRTVAARYLTLLIMLGIVFLASVLLSAGVWVVEGPDEALSALLSGLVCLAMGTLLNAIALPLIYKFGAERAWLIFFAALFGLIGLAALWLIPLGGLEWLARILPQLENSALTALSLLCMAACFLLPIPSCLASCAIYRKKDL